MRRTSWRRKLINPVAITGLSIHRYHAAHCVSSQLSLLKSVLAYNIEADVYAGAVIFDIFRVFVFVSTVCCQFVEEN